MNFTKIKYFLKKILSSIIKIFLQNTVLTKYHYKPIYLAAEFVCAENIDGDYLEFGVFKGHSFIEAFHACEDAQKKWSSKKVNENAFENKKIANKNFQQISIKKSMRYFAFDSFKGLPEIKTSDTEHSRFHKGRFESSKNFFLTNCKNNYVNTKKTITIEGFYENSLTNAMRKEHQLNAASIIMIDCDLYSSTKSVLNFITPLLRNGTVLIFDDWFAYKGSPNEGEQKATKEWLQLNPNILLSEHARFGPSQKSFIVHLL